MLHKCCSVRAAAPMLLLESSKTMLQCERCSISAAAWMLLQRCCVNAAACMLLHGCGVIWALGPRDCSCIWLISNEVPIHYDTTVGCYLEIPVKGGVYRNLTECMGIVPVWRTAILAWTWKWAKWTTIWAVWTPTRQYVKKKWTNLSRCGEKKLVKVFEKGTSIQFPKLFKQLHLVWPNID